MAPAATTPRRSSPVLRRGSIASSASRTADKAAAINRGLHMGSGWYATWINSDDMLCKDAFWHLFSQHHLTEDMIIVGDCDEIDESGAPLRRHRGFVQSLTDLLRVKTVWESGGHLCQPEIVFPLALALRVGGLNEHNHYSMDYELWGELLLAGASIRYTGIPTGIFRRHRGQKTEDSGRQVASTLDAAESLVARAHFLSPQVRQELRAELDAYRREYPALMWRDSGRLARLGLPRFLVNAIRRVRCRISPPMGQPRGSAE